MVCLQNFLALSTLRSYQSGACQYVSFCNFFRFTPFPANEFILCLFVVSLARRNLSYRTIKVYLFGIQFHSLMHGFPVRVSSMSFLFYTLRGIRRIQGNSLRRPLRRPITISYIWTIYGFLESSHFSDHDKAMWRCMVVFTVFGLFRVSEFTCRDRVFNGAVHISPICMSESRLLSRILCVPVASFV